MKRWKFNPQLTFSECLKLRVLKGISTVAVIRTLHFDSETGMPQYDPVARKVYVNLQDTNIFAVIDPSTDEVIGRFILGNVDNCFGFSSFIGYVQLVIGSGIRASV